MATLRELMANNPPAQAAGGLKIRTLDTMRSEIRASMPPPGMSGKLERQLDQVEPAEKIPMEFVEEGDGLEKRLWFDCLCSTEGERCLYLEPACVWLGVQRQDHSNRVVLFHHVDRPSMLATELIKSGIRILNPNGERISDWGKSNINLVTK